MYFKRKLFYYNTKYRGQGGYGKSASKHSPHGPATGKVLDVAQKIFIGFVDNHAIGRLLNKLDKLSVFGEPGIFKTPQPSFAWLGGSHHRMSRANKMCPGMAGGRRIAAEGCTTGLAGSQMHPLTARLGTFVTPVGGCSFYLVKSSQMAA